MNSRLILLTELGGGFDYIPFSFLVDEGTENLSDLTYITQLVSGWARIHTHTSVWLQCLCSSLGDNGGQEQEQGPRAHGAGLGAVFGVAATALGRAGELCIPGCCSGNHWSGLGLPRT